MVIKSPLLVVKRVEGRRVEEGLCGLWRGASLTSASRLRRLFPGAKALRGLKRVPAFTACPALSSLAEGKSRFAKISTGFPIFVPSLPQPRSFLSGCPAPAHLFLLSLHQPPQLNSSACSRCASSSSALCTATTPSAKTLLPRPISSSSFNFTSLQSHHPKWLVFFPPVFTASESPLGACPCRPPLISLRL